LDDIDEVVRWTALYLLVESGPEAVLSFDVAVRLLSDPDWDVRSVALRLIVTCWADEPATLDRLVLASRDSDPDNRQAALEALVVGWPRHPLTLATLTDAETDVIISTRDFARRTRMRLRLDPHSAEALSADPRSAALERLRQADLRRPDDPASKHVGLELARSADWWIRWEALGVLARRWPDWSETDLVWAGALDDDNRNIRRDVVREADGQDPGLAWHCSDASPSGARSGLGEPGGCGSIAPTVAQPGDAGRSA
jgi:hypothetical protein